jgi:hypothetical protein
VRRATLFARARLASFAILAATVGLFGAVGDANAQFVLDSGTPAGSSELVLSTAQSFAAEFYITSGQTVTDLSAYLMPSTGSANNFEFEIFSTATAFIGSGARSPTLVYSISAPVSASAGTPGWNSVATNWTPTASGDYWLAILEPNTGTTLDLQSETSTTTGTAPAIEFASTNTPGTRYQVATTGVGLEVTATPIPAAVWLFLSGLGGLGLFGRRKTH